MGSSSIASTTLAPERGAVTVAGAGFGGGASAPPAIRGGMVRVKVEPSPSRLSTSIRPPSRRASRWLIASPSPVPLWDRVALLST